MFEPDVIAPSQFLNAPDKFRSGELRLLFAVLEDALRVYARAVSVEHDEEARTAAWIENDEALGFMSYRFVCEVFDLPYDRLREAARRRRTVVAG